MEIVTAPYQRSLLTWRTWLLLAAVLAPVTLLALVPIGLGLDRYVITGNSMAPAIDRGSVTSRIVAIEPGAARTRADARPHLDPWPLALDKPTQDRVVLALPYVGYLYLVLVHPGPWTGLVMFLGSALALALTVERGRRRKGRAA
jgi:signal peptidase